MDNNEEYLRLNKDFLLLSALIKSHKAKTAQQDTARGRLSWNKDVRTHPSRQASSSQPKQNSSLGQSTKYVKDQNGPTASTNHRGKSRSRRYVVGSRKQESQSAHPSSSLRSGTSKLKVGSLLPPRERPKSRTTPDHVPGTVAVKGRQIRENVLSTLSQKGGNRDLTRKDLPGSSHSRNSHASRASSAGIIPTKFRTCENGTPTGTPPIKPKVAPDISEGVISKSALSAASSDAKSMARGSKDHLIVSGMIPQRLSSNTNCIPKSCPVNATNRGLQSKQVTSAASDDKNIRTDSGKYIKLRAAPHDKQSQESKIEVVESTVSTEPPKHLVAGPVTFATGKVQSSKQETVDPLEIMDHGSNACSGPKRTVLSTEKRPDATKAACAESLVAPEPKKRGGRSASRLDEDDRDCEIARMNALSAYLSQLRNRATSKDSRSIPVTSACGNGRTGRPAVCDPASKAHLAKSGVRGMTVRDTPAQPSETPVTSACGNGRTGRPAGCDPAFKAHLAKSGVRGMTVRDTPAQPSETPLTSACGNGRTGRPAGCDPAFKAHLAKSGVRGMTVRDTPAEPSGSATSTHREGIEGRREMTISPQPAGSPDKLLSTQRRINELTEDIKRIEEQLSSGKSLKGGTVSDSPMEKKPGYSWVSSSPSSSAIKGSTQSLASSSPKKMTAYSWSASTQSASDQERSRMAAKMLSVPKVTRRTMPYKLARSRGDSRHKANPYQKINTNSRGAVPAAGGESLHKTRSRFKVRKSQGRPEMDRRALRLGKEARSKVNRGRSVSTQAVSRSVKDARMQVYTKLPHDAHTSPYKMHTKKHGKCYSPYKMRRGTRRSGLWDEYERHSFVTRRLHHMVTHSPMLFRSNPFLSGHRSLHKLDRIWHSPRSLVKQLRWQIPGGGYHTPRSPYLASTSRPYLTPKRSQLVLKRQHHQRGKSSHSQGKQAMKKVMNVVKIGGVRYARHGKSLRRLSSHDEARQLHPSGGDVLPVTHRKITSTKIVAKQVLYRSIHFSRMLKSRKSRKQEYCMFFNRFGRCNKGDSCPYKHDPEKVAICTRFLRGTCKLTGGACPYSHKVTKDKMPVCRFFLRGVCTQEDCPYSHVKVNNSASICRDFVRGYCAKGEKCTLKHLLECADYSQTGHCSRKHCPLWHKKRRSEGSQKRQKSKLGDRDAMIEPKRPTNQKQDTTSFIVLHDDTEHSGSPSTSRVGSSEDPAAPIQIRPVFLKRT